MPSPPVSSEIAAALGKFFFAGAGPSHSTLTRAFLNTGYGQDDPYDEAAGAPNKQQRVLAVVNAARRRPAGARRLVDELLTALRMEGCLEDPSLTSQRQALGRALSRAGWALDADGYMTTVGVINLETGGRSALDEQLARLQRNSEDPAALLGGAKDLLESISKFVLEERMMLPDRRLDFDEALHLALDQLGLLPKLVDTEVPGAKQLRAIYQSAKTTASTVNELRNLQGTGHGRTLPTGVNAEAGRYVIREAAHVAELMLAAHDRQMGRSE
ncbi:abortive infection family protein [Phytoactinopolyspora halotolerans]|uniref:Abortive infection family protein n=1 Tax=Phytoactinopolyspora halotolerans TaxID=1981512 RepID=A0A6L9SAC7_9ACTN|nr:abortive infection family protein [Phytoactinopolyspora halotolerans]NEE01512.1 abortive infection family protein [Phytoactinopolyspora halotolerans]